MGASESQQTNVSLTAIEICAGAGGQAVGLHKAGFEHLALVELDLHAVEALRQNVEEHEWTGWPGEGGRAERLKSLDVKTYLDSAELKSLKLEPGDLDLLAGGVPCPPFSLAGKRLGADDERDLFPYMLELVDKLKPKAVMIENVRGILEPPHVFIDYRKQIIETLREFGYRVPVLKDDWSVEDQDCALRKVWRRLDANNFGVPQLRPRAILVAFRDDIAEGENFVWPKRLLGESVGVYRTLEDTMRKRCEKFWDKNQKGETAQADDRTGQQVFEYWADHASKAEAGPTAGIAPTLVGGSKKHGGADLGPTRAKRAWALLGVDANGVANDMEQCDPGRDLFRKAGPMLTVLQAAKLQGFPETWKFSGGKTAQYRQVGNAFPPPVAEAVGRAIAAVLNPASCDDYRERYVTDETRPAAEPSTQAAIFSASDLAEQASAGDDGRRDLVSA